MSVHCGDHTDFAIYESNIQYQNNRNKTTKSFLRQRRVRASLTCLRLRYSDQHSDPPVWGFYDGLFQITYIDALVRILKAEVIIEIEITSKIILIRFLTRR